MTYGNFGRADDATTYNPRAGEGLGSGGGYGDTVRDPNKPIGVGDLAKNRNYQDLLARRMGKDPYGADLASKAWDQYAAAQSRQTPQAGWTSLAPAATMSGATYGGATLGSAAQASGDSSADAATRARQISLMNAVQAQANGTGPSYGTQALQAGFAQQQAQQRGLASGAPAAGGAMRQYAMSNAMGGQGVAAQGAQVRAQEQLAGQQQLAAMSGQLRAGDLGAFGVDQQYRLGNQNATNQFGLARAGYGQQAGMQNAQFANAAGLANAGAQNQFGLAQSALDQQTRMSNLATQMQAQGMNDDQIRAMLAQISAKSSQDTSSMMNAWQFSKDSDFARAMHEREMDTANYERNMGLLASGGSAITQFALSDGQKKNG